MIRPSGLEGSLCLVTGASGVVGRALVTELLACGAKVRASDVAPPPDGFPPLAGDYEHLRRDLSKPGVAEELVDGCEVVFHLAAKMPQANLDEEGFRRANVGTAWAVADAAKRAGVRRMVFASTIEVYGPQERSAPLSEDDAKEFTGPYSRNKWEVEQMLLGSGASGAGSSHSDGDGGMEAVALRMPMIFGPGFYHEKAVLSLFVALRAGLPLPVPAPRALVSFVASSDVAQAMRLAAVVPEAAGEAFNVAAPDHPTMLEFFHQLVELSGSRSRVLVVPERLVDRAIEGAKRRADAGRTKVLGGTPAELVGFIKTGGAYSIDKARSVLGYEPRHTCASAWLSAYRWFWSIPLKRRYAVMFRQHV